MPLPIFSSYPMVTDSCYKLGYFLVAIHHDELSCKYKNPIDSDLNKLAFIFVFLLDEVLRQKTLYFVSEVPQCQGSRP